MVDSVNMDNFLFTSKYNHIANTNRNTKSILPRIIVGAKFILYTLVLSIRFFIKYLDLQLHVTDRPQNKYASHRCKLFSLL